ncbi:MAG: hypothetical protein H0W73_05600 [Bacteroidetes bacterium]|nr:hypothetical protein [Bacteroidota bacterium]
MNYFKYIILSACFILVMNVKMLSQNSPFPVLITSADKALRAVTKKHKQLHTPLNNNLLKFHPSFKGTNSKQELAARILNWDMKFKFRLSPNLNIIFSYN